MSLKVIKDFNSVKVIWVRFQANGLAASFARLAEGFLEFENMVWRGSIGSSLISNTEGEGDMQDYNPFQRE